VIQLLNIVNLHAQCSGPLEDNIGPDSAVSTYMAGYLSTNFDPLQSILIVWNPGIGDASHL
jgi:hypothetical protein